MFKQSAKQAKHVNSLVIVWEGGFRPTILIWGGGEEEVMFICKKADARSRRKVIPLDINITSAGVVDQGAL